MIFIDEDAYERVFREAVSLVNGICKQAQCKKDILAKRYFDEDEWYALRVQLKDGSLMGLVSSFIRTGKKMTLLVTSWLSKMADLMVRVKCTK